jgi:hypothetical protein
MRRIVSKTASPPLKNLPPGRSIERDHSDGASPGRDGKHRPVARRARQTYHRDGLIRELLSISL